MIRSALSFSALVDQLSGMVLSQFGFHLLENSRSELVAVQAYRSSSRSGATSSSASARQARFHALFREPNIPVGAGFRCP
jgi:hypothetical protein